MKWSKEERYAILYWCLKVTIVWSIYASALIEYGTSLEVCGLEERTFQTLIGVPTLAMLINHCYFIVVWFSDPDHIGLG